MKQYFLLLLFTLSFGFSPILLLGLLEVLGYNLGNESEGGLIMIGYLTFITLPSSIIVMIGFLAQFIYDYFKTVKRKG